VIYFPVPIYEYEPIDGDCKACGGHFEIRRPISRPPLLNCPVCKKAVRKVVSSASSPKITKSVSVSDAKKSGFTVYKKRDKGVYEKL